MKHATVNSIVGSLLLLVAAITAWFQFSPTSDRLQVVSEGRVLSGMPLRVAAGKVPDPQTGTLHPVLGPISWKVRVHNETDRVVSIVDWRMFLIFGDEGLAQYSSMKPTLSGVDPSLTPLSLPINIPARETTAYLVSAFIPFDRDALEQSACFDPLPQIQEAERCVYSTGKDIFGNPISIKRYDSAIEGAYSVHWVNQERTPRFLIELDTADGSQFSANLYYTGGF